MPLSVLVSSRPSHPPFASFFYPLQSADSLHAYITVPFRLASSWLPSSFSLFLSRCFLVSFICPSFSFYSFHFCLSSPLFSSIICFASTSPSPRNDPRSLPLSLCPTSQLFRNDVIRAIGVDLITFSKKFLWWNCLVQILVIIDFCQIMSI